MAEEQLWMKHPGGGSVIPTTRAKFERLDCKKGWELVDKPVEMRKSSPGKAPDPDEIRRQELANRVVVKDKDLSGSRERKKSAVTAVNPGETRRIEMEAKRKFPNRPTSNRIGIGFGNPLPPSATTSTKKKGKRGGGKKSGAGNA